MLQLLPVPLKINNAVAPRMKMQFKRRPGASGPGILQWAIFDAKIPRILHHRNAEISPSQGQGLGLQNRRCQFADLPRRMRKANRPEIHGDDQNMHVYNNLTRRRRNVKRFLAL